jgi:hypothetical protein
MVRSRSRHDRPPIEAPRHPRVGTQVSPPSLPGSAGFRKTFSTAGLLLVFGSLLAVGAVAAATRLSASLRSRPEKLVPDWITVAVPAVQASLPPDVPVLYVTREPNTWRCGLWQRLLLPHSVFCLRPADTSAAEFNWIRSKFPIRYAIGVGDPPDRITVRKRRTVSGPLWVGELAP